MATPNQETQPTQQPAKTPKKRTATAPANETPDQRFKRLGSRRMALALKVIGAVGNLGNRRQCAYTIEQKDRVIKALTDAVAGVKAAFEAPEQTKPMLFAL